jgi:hypothetical protein
MCYGVDHCTDGTLEWLQELSKIDPLVKFIVNNTGQRLGHTVMYDKIVHELVETDLAMIWHSDMYLCEGALDAIEGLMYEIGCDSTGDPDGGYFEYYESENRNIIVSLTRIEPPLHPSGPEKIVKDFGTEPENFNERGLIDFVKSQPHKNPTNGVFAPWCFWVNEFKEMGGHDWLYRPQSKEDSDIFNRYQLKHGKNCFKQTWQGFVYHLTCRGSRYNPTLTQVGMDSAEWSQQNNRSYRNFIRKWHSLVKHTDTLEPIVSPVYHTTFIIHNCSFIDKFEIWCDKLILPNCNKNYIEAYIKDEQPNTDFDLRAKIHNYKIDFDAETDIIVEFDMQRFDQHDFNNIVNLSDIIAQSGEVGEFELGNLKVKILKMQPLEHSLIAVKNKNIDLN